MNIIYWLTKNYIEIFGAVAGIVYVFFEIKQNPLLWPVGIITSGVYIYVFFTGKLYADMSLQVYYVIISILGWYWWVRKTHKEEIMKGGENYLDLWGSNAAQGEENEGVDLEMNVTLRITRVGLKSGIVIATIFLLLWAVLWILLTKLTDSPVPGADSFIASLSIVATWMLARKLYEHWYLWIVVNLSMSILCYIRGLYPTLVLYLVYGTMSFIGLREWAKTINSGKE